MSAVLSVHVERWLLASTFTISRGAKTEAVTVSAELVDDGGHRGRGECVPYARYGETVEAVAASIEAMREPVRRGLDRAGFWDLEAKRSGVPAYRLAGLPPPRPLVTAYTISLGTPAAMAEAATKASTRPLLKVKLGGDGDPERIRAVRRAAPKSELIVDANEAWDPDHLDESLAACAEVGVTLIEQPLPAAADGALDGLACPIAICADESVHDRASLAGLVGKYAVVNIKLDKAGGLTEALRLADEAERAGLGLMVGCMVATSLAMAPAVLLAQRARVVDLDGPLLLAADRPDGLTYDGSLVHPPTRALWG
jgi:L-alanine-DL-glutamate epimerase-like enolase superfamily enzyme